jgi:hypothetical protein
MRTATTASLIFSPMMAGLALALAADLPAAAQQASAPAAAAMPAPRLASGVKPAERGYEPVSGRWTVALPSPFYADVSPYSAATTREYRIGEPVILLAKVRDMDWYLVGQNGVGVGYINSARISRAAG